MVICSLCLYKVDDVFRLLSATAIEHVYSIHMHSEIYVQTYS